MSGSSLRRTSAHGNLADAFTDPALSLLRENAPEIYDRFIKAEMTEWRHRRRLGWADLAAQVIGHLSGLVALVVLGAISWHAIDRGDATQGASIICTGAVSIVAVFVTGRLVAVRDGKKHGG
jgi:hypothetical protein